MFSSEQIEVLVRFWTLYVVAKDSPQAVTADPLWVLTRAERLANYVLTGSILEEK
jgi:TolB-like protein